jgi:hypothetical protein
MTISEKIKQLIKQGKRGTQAGLARHLGIHQSVLSTRLKRIKYRWQYPDLKKVAEYFDIPIDYFGVDVQIGASISEPVTEYGTKRNDIETSIGILKKLMEDCQLRVLDIVREIEKIDLINKQQ